MAWGLRPAQVESLKICRDVHAWLKTFLNYTSSIREVPNVEGWTNWSFLFIESADYEKFGTESQEPIRKPKKESSSVNFVGDLCPTIVSIFAIHFLDVLV